MIQAEVIHCFSLVTGHSGDGLGQIHGASPANAHDQVAFSLPGDFRSFIGQFQPRLGFSLVEKADLQAALTENVSHLFMESGLCQIFIKHNQGTTAPQRLDMFRQFCKGPRSENNLSGPGKGKRFDHGHSPIVFDCL